MLAHALWSLGCGCFYGAKKYDDEKKEEEEEKKTKGEGKERERSNDTGALAADETRREGRNERGGEISVRIAA